MTVRNQEIAGTSAEVSAKDPFRRLYGLIRGDWRRLLAGTLAALLSASAGVALLAVSGHFITSMALAGVGGLAINYYTPAAMVRLLAILRTGGRYTERLLTHDATLSILARLRRWLFGRLVPLAPAALGELGSAELYSRLRADVDTLEHAYLGVLIPLIVASVIASAVVLTAMLYLPLLALLLALLFIVAGVALPGWMQRQGDASSRVADQQSEAMRWQIADGLRGRAELALFDAEAVHAQRLTATATSRRQARRRLEQLQARAHAGVSLLTQLALATALVLGIPALRRGTLSGADLSLLAMLALAGFETFAALPGAWARMGAVRAAAERIFELADRRPVVVEAAEPVSLPGSSRLDIRQLHLRYSEHTPWVLDGVDLQLATGRHLAIVGASGAGKSSLIGALTRLYPWQGGDILLGGVPLPHLRGDDVRRQFAVVEQRPWLFDASLRDNLLLARPEANDAELIEALQQAQLTDYLHALPQGLDSWIGEDGSRLSGGEARRLAIARGLLSQAPILILDEPTEGLDNHTAAALYRTLAKVTRERSVLLITHKLGALAELVDDVATMDAGRIQSCVTVADYLRAQGSVIAAGPDLGIKQNSAGLAASHHGAA